MDGLLPLVFKAIKKNKTRSRYECLSSGPAQSCNAEESYGHIGTQSNSAYMTHSGEQNMEERYSHRRHKSVGDIYVGYSSASGDGGGVRGGSPPPKQKQQLVRFRSHRMFSCVTGAS